jgi:hypothetical protein
MKISLVMLSLLFLTQCPTAMPIFAGKLYHGNSKEAAIIRANPGEPEEIISSSDPEFDKFTCTKTADLINYLAEVQKALSHCKSWK